MELKNKTVIVTGAGSGIGRALALEFGARGARVVCTSRRAQRIEETAAAIEAKGGTAIAVPTDVTDLRQVEHLVARSIEAFGRIDVLFNNAGSFNALGAAWEVDPDVWWTDVTVHLRGVMLCCRAVLPHMIERDSGLLINMSGGDNMPGGSGYCSSKVALVRYTELLSKELKQRGSSVLAFIMGPGFVRTEMTELQIGTPAGKEWLPIIQDFIKKGLDRPPEECARATMELIRVACPELNGGNFGPDTDFDKALEDAKRQVTKSN